MSSKRPTRPLRPDIETPCVNVCTVDPATRRCLGCERTLDEIATWGTMKPDERRLVMAELPARKLLRANT